MVPRLPDVQRLARLGTRAATRVANQVRSGGFGERASRNGMVPDGAVGVLFATGPENFYQLEQWLAPLERVARRRPVFVLVDRPDTGERVLTATSLPVVFARGSAAWERVVTEHHVKVMLYVNQVEPNFRMLRFPGPVHVQLGHGESDKDTSRSNQHKAYDLTFVGGPAGRDRLVTALRGFDGASRTVAVGRPQIDESHPGAPDWPRDSGRRVLYAPTWEGDRPALAYGSLASHGPALVAALLAEPDLRVIYRPHPRTHQTGAAYARADAEVRALLAKAGDQHLVDEGPYGWQWGFADACVTDISAVAYDWLATGKPLVVTEPVSSEARWPESPLLDRLGLLPARDAGSVLARLAEPHPALAELVGYYFGDTSPGASSARFAAAIEQAYALPGPVVAGS